MTSESDQSDTVVWSHPLPPGEARERWISCVLDTVEIEKRDGVGHMASHWVFCRKVLRERKEALAIAGRFQRVALTRDVMEGMADDWWEPPSQSDDPRLTERGERARMATGRGQRVGRRLARSPLGRLFPRRVALWLARRRGLLR